MSLRIDNTISFLRVRLGGATIGLPAAAVREIVRAVAITPLPGAPDIVEGAVNVRGRLVPVIDVRRLLGFPARQL
ncbi:MAG: chemotaxis protein CheW, partial [bacterium]